MDPNEPVLSSKKTKREKGKHIRIAIRDLRVHSSWIDCIPDFLVVSIQSDRSGAVLEHI
jgi:hypothetical protein